MGDFWLASMRLNHRSNTDNNLHVAAQSPAATCRDPETSRTGQTAPVRQVQVRELSKGFRGMAGCLILVFSLMLGGQGCGLVDMVFLKPPQDTAQELMEAGNLAMEEKDYDDAADYYTKLKERYPFSPYTPQAELRLADAYFLDGRFLAAEDAYKEFEALHPGHPDIPYVLFQIGLSNFKQFKSIDLPQDNITEALQYFQRVSENHPDTGAGPEASKYILQCKKFQAEHEVFVADFYWRTQDYLSAWKRYQYVVRNYKDLPQIHDYALKRSRLAYFKFQEHRSEAERAAQRGSWKQWFDWL